MLVLTSKSREAESEVTHVEHGFRADLLVQFLLQLVLLLPFRLQGLQCFFHLSITRATGEEDVSLTGRRGARHAAYLLMITRSSSSSGDDGRIGICLSGRRRRQGKKIRRSGKRERMSQGEDMPDSGKQVIKRRTYITCMRGWFFGGREKMRGS